MKKAHKMVQWGNEMFSISNEKGYEPRYEGIFLSEVYARPSYNKLAIDDYWRCWLRANDEGNGWIAIASHNCNFFTMCGVIEKDGTKYGFKIYPTRNIAWELEKEVR